MTSIGDPGGSAGRRLFRDAQLPPLVCGEEETLVSTRGRFARQGGPMFALATLVTTLSFTFPGGAGFQRSSQQ